MHGHAANRINKGIQLSNSRAFCCRIRISAGSVDRSNHGAGLISRSYRATFDAMVSPRAFYILSIQALTGALKDKAAIRLGIAALLKECKG